MLAWTLAALLSSEVAAAKERLAIVIIARGVPEDPWPAATQATVAELAAGDYQVLVESSWAGSIEGLKRELASWSNESRASGAVALVSSGTMGIAYVWTRSDDEITELRATLTDGTVGEGALALRIAELIRSRDLQMPAIPDEPTAERARSERQKHSGAVLWAGGGPIFTSAGSAPLAALAFGAQVPTLGPLAIDATVSLSFVPLRLEMDPGRVDISSRNFTGHLLFTLPVEAVSLAVGAGGGLAWLEQQSQANAGFEATSDATTVGTISIRARARFESRALSFLMLAEPGLMLPNVSVRSDEREIANVGRPWVFVAFGVGFQP